MDQQTFGGFALIGVAAFHLIPAWRTGEISSRWPYHPLTRETQPARFRRTVLVFSVAALIGAAMLLDKILAG